MATTTRLPPNAGKGRPKGVPNKTTREIRAYARALLEGPGMREAHERAVRRNPDGPLAMFLYAHAYGKPVERVEQGGPGAFADLSDEGLRQRLAAALEHLQ